MALGAKIVAPVPKKPDPIEAFEKGVHTPDGKVHFGYDKGRDGGDWTDFRDYVRKIVAETTGVRREWVKGALVEVKIPVGETVEFFTGHDGHAIAPDIRAIRALSDEVATPRQNAIAAKMAEVQRQKQELRALARKDYKR